MPKPKPKLSNQPFTPRGAELGPLPMPTEEEIVAELMAEAEAETAGLLDAGVGEAGAMDDDAVEVIRVEEFRVSGYEIQVAGEWVPWARGWRAPVPSSDAIVYTDRNGYRSACPAPVANESEDHEPRDPEGA